MATLNYIIGEVKKYKLVLITDHIINIDKATIKKKSPTEFISQMKYSEQIGMFIYDNEDEITETDIIQSELKIEYTPTSEDYSTLSPIISNIRDKNLLEINPIFSDNYFKIDQNVLEKSIIEKNKSLKQYLKELSTLKNYYFYLRILDNYYNQSNDSAIRNKI